MVLICISLVTTEVKEFFSRLLENHISYFIMCVFKSLTHVFTGFSFIICMSSLHILNMSLLLYVFQVFPRFDFF